MQNKMQLYFMMALLSILMLVPIIAAAQDSRERSSLLGKSGVAEDCPMEQKAQINLNWNSKESDLKQVKAKMDQKIEEIIALAPQAGITKIEMKSLNYNVYPQNEGGCGESDDSKTYNLSGNISFDVSPVEKAVDFMALLEEKKVSANLNVNSYKQCH